MYKYELIRGYFSVNFKKKKKKLENIAYFADDSLKKRGKARKGDKAARKCLKSLIFVFFSLEEKGLINKSLFLTMPNRSLKMLNRIN